MNRMNDSSSKSEKKLNLITAVLIASGTVISICLVFFFVQLFNAQSDSIKPKVFSVKQIGATDTSVLLVWNGSEVTKEFIVRYRSSDSMETTEFRTDKSFAAIHGLEPFKRYTADVIPVENDTEYDSSTVVCSTSPYCHVTEVTVDEITNNSCHVQWKYEGIDEGFTIAAYAVDKAGKRHITSEFVTVSKGSPSECTVNQLLSELCYTVCVMPNTKYVSVGKSTFLTQKYSRSYNKYEISRFVTCTADSTDSVHVDTVTNLNPGAPYKSSIIISGSATPTDKVTLEIYVTDAEGVVTCHSKREDVSLNPEGKKSYFYSSYALDITAPAEPGTYNVFAVIDGVTVRKNTFKVNA